MKNPTPIEVANHLAKRLKACKVPKDGETPYTDECLMARSREALESDSRELYFSPVGDIWVPSLEYKYLHKS